jgi:Protein of unknown function (DUF3237)
MGKFSARIGSGAPTRGVVVLPGWSHLPVTLARRLAALGPSIRPSRIFRRASAARRGTSRWRRLAAAAPSGVLEQDVRVTLKTDDGAFIYVRYAGMRHGPPGSYGAAGAGREGRSQRVLLPHRANLRDWGRALRVAKQNLGCGCGREITAKYGSVFDF